MPITRSLENGQKVVDWTEEVNEMDNLYGAINGTGLFQGKGVATESIVFDKNMQTHTLIPQVSRRGGEHSKGKDRKTETYAIALPYFNHQDYVTPQDIQGFRGKGPDGVKQLQTAIADKMEDMRISADQTREYMKINALKGVTVDAEGNEIANMFTIFGTTQKEVDFDLSNPASDIDGHINEVKRHVAKTAKQGGRISGIEFMVSPEFFDLLVAHPRIREAYALYAANPASDVIRANLAKYEAWGVTDTFVHKGVTFWSYDAEFTNAGGNVVSAFDEDPTVEGGYSLVTGIKDLYRAYFGPANTLSGVNAVGSEMNLYQFRDPKDKFYEMELEMSPLYLMMRPQASVKIKA